jgi:pimeloyl-ACP methyl ester carboxylesterase
MAEHTGVGLRTETIMNPWRVVLRCGISCVAVWILLCAMVGVVAVEGALHQVRRMLRPADESLARSIATRNHAELTDVSIAAKDGVILRAWSIRPSAGNGNAVILLHGVADNRAGMLGNADMLLRHGYAVLLPDARSHGESGGPIVTYGFLEPRIRAASMAWVNRWEARSCCVP